MSIINMMYVPPYPTAGDCPYCCPRCPCCGRPLRRPYPWQVAGQEIRWNSTPPPADAIPCQAEPNLGPANL